MTDRNLVVFAALNGALAVVLGAFAAHGAGPQIKTLLTTGAHYQLAHAVFALACAVWTGGGRIARVAGWLGAAGGVVFSRSLAVIALLDCRAPVAKTATARPPEGSDLSRSILVRSREEACPSGSSPGRRASAQRRRSRIDT